MSNKPNNFIVVDDDTTNNLICEFTIRRFNPQAQITIFRDPEVALEGIRQLFTQQEEQRPTVLFLDLNMPNMTGWEFLERFQAFEDCIKAHFTIYVLTSSIEDFSQQSHDYPFVSGFLSKPMKMEKLEEIPVV